MNIMDSLNEALRVIITFVPKLAAFLLILLIGWLIAKGLRKLVDVGLTRLRFDRAMERGGIQQAMEGSKYDPKDLVTAVVYYAVLLLALQTAFGVFGQNPVSDLLTAIVAWLPQLAVAIIIVVVAAAIAGVVRDLTSSVLSRFSWSRFVARGAQVFIIALGVIAALNQMGIATTVTMPVLIAVLATVGGVLVVGVGGGMVRPMQQRWDRWLGRAEDELPAARSEMAAYQRGREDALRAEQPTEATSTEPTEYGTR
ncbi:MAG: hypothetical protein GEU97_17040 [Actinophytocola sp.]|nr:hypothetical protein [Actinophytocola sp.]